VAQTQPPRAAALGFGEVAQRGELELRRSAALQQVQQRRDRGGGEARERERMQEGHAISRNAIPKGRSVRTW